MALHQINGIKVRTGIAPTPWPVFEWAAVDDSTYDGNESDPIGRGAAEQQAIADLIEQIEEKA